jgi:hypothetical protein
MTIRPELLDELLKDYAKPEDLTGENGLLKQLTKALVERALDAEMDVHLDDPKYQTASKAKRDRRNGHADWDTPRNPQREKQISEERARAAANWLQAYVGTVAAQIQWQAQGLGATQLKAPPTTEANRRQNRRIEVVARRGAAAPPRPKPVKPAIEILSPINGTFFAISAEPAMPAIEAKVRIVEVTPDPTSATLFEWKAEIKHDARICTNGPNRTIKAPDIVATLKGNQSFKPSFNFILGGELTITVKDKVNGKVNGKVLTAKTKGLRIEGINPDCQTLRALLPKLLFQMACHESHLQQFRTLSGSQGRCPIYSGDKLGGVGLFQITNPRPTEASHWNWQANLAQMKVILADKTKLARGYPAQVRRQKGFKELVDRFNQRRDFYQPYHLGSHPARAV